MTTNAEFFQSLQGQMEDLQSRKDSLPPEVYEEQMFQLVSLMRDFSNNIRRGLGVAEEPVVKRPGAGGCA